MAVAMFLPAGIGWRKGSLFLGVFFLETAIAAVYFCWKNPAVFFARSKLQKGTKGWDKLLFYLLQTLIVAILPVAGLGSRYHWSSVCAVGDCPRLRPAYHRNGRELLGDQREPVRRGRRSDSDGAGHQVVDCGPYAVVRHPMYAFAVVLIPGMPLALGSLWALLPAALASAVLIVRTVLENRTLQKELAGYRQYAEKVRYRLIPGLW